MAFEPHRILGALLLSGLACASGPKASPTPESDVDCRQSAPNLIHVVKTVGGQAAKRDSYELCVSREGALLYVRGSAPVQRQLNDEQMQSLKTVLARASEKQRQEISHSCTHSRSLLVEWIWSGKSFAAHEACDENQPVVATEIRDAAWRILKLETAKH